jgi:GNAT superfamily N-acetyltransferase
MEIRPRGERDNRWIESLLRRHWGSTLQVTRGQVHDALRLPGFVAVRLGRRSGLITYRPDGVAWEIVTLNSQARGRGVGSALVDTVRAAALQASRRRLWLIATNDNVDALRFWQKRGFVLRQLHPDALALSRRLKPEIPLLGAYGIPIRDELELVLELHP